MFVSFEGMEGCGKSTQAENLARLLEASAVPVLLTREPGGTRIGQEIRRLLLDERNRNLTAEAEFFLYLADRSQHVAEVIRPALEQGHWVICDRFLDATTVYQGFGRGIDFPLAAELNRIATRGIGPRITFLLDCPVKVGLARARKRRGREAGQERFEKEVSAFHETVRRGYLAVARAEPRRIRVLDATMSEEDIRRIVLEHLRPFLPFAPAAG